MERLTMTSDKGGVAFTFDLDINCRPSEAQKILKLAQKLKEYEDIEEKITKKFAGCIDMKTILDSFCAFYDMQETNEDLAQCTLLTNEDALKYRQWKEAEEQGLLLRLPCKIGETVYCFTPFCEICEETLDNQFACEDCNKGSFVSENKFDYEMIRMFGRSIFLTKEEAEQALARMEKTHE